MKNDPNRLPPIPTPPSAVWREFRIRVIPFFVFIVVAVAAVYMWKVMPMSGSLRGVGEGVRSVVTSPRVGILQKMEVQPFQWVEAGDPLVTVLPFDPDAQLDLLQSELQITRLRLEPSVAQRNALNFEQVRVDAFTLEQEVEMAKASLEQAEILLKLNEGLLKEKLVSQYDYQISLRDRNVFQAEVTVKSNSLEKINARLAELSSLGVPQETNVVNSAAIGRLEERMLVVETNWSPIILRAPISGRVHMIARQQGEFVVEGEQLVLIVSPRSERIVAYMRQPFMFEPQPGMEVEVVMQNRQRQTFATRITEVGAQMEAITNALAMLPTGALVDMGLPIVVAVPPTVQLRPGETVGISLKSSPLNIFSGKQARVEETKPLVQLDQ